MKFWGRPWPLAYMTPRLNWAKAFPCSAAFLNHFAASFQRLMPGDEEVQSTDEDFDAFGTVVEVAETIAKGEQGRIRYRGTTWVATCYERTLEPGSQARLVTRDGIGWVVEPVEEGPEELV